MSDRHNVNENTITIGPVAKIKWTTPWVMWGVSWLAFSIAAYSYGDVVGAATTTGLFALVTAAITGLGASWPADDDGGA